MNIFLIGDTHFDHANLLLYTNNDGRKCREFDNVDQMNEAIVTAWNETVKAGDHVYHLGDFTMKKTGLRFGKMLNGKKRLVRGNHDIFKTKDYLEIGFEEIHGARVLDDVVLTHIPIHPMNLKDRWLGNVHGHLHNKYNSTSYTPELGPKYFNVSCEVLQYRPISLEDVRATLTGAQKIVVMGGVKTND